MEEIPSGVVSDLQFILGMLVLLICTICGCLSLNVQKCIFSSVHYTKANKVAEWYTPQSVLLWYKYPASSINLFLLRVVYSVCCCRLEDWNGG